MFQSFFIAIKLGDDDPLSWVVTALYFVTFGLCLKAAHSEVHLAKRLRPNAKEETDGMNRGRNTPSNSRLWLAIATAMFVLGINKQADIQSIFDRIAKQTARTLGWYEYRSLVKMAFVVFLAGVTMIAAFVILRTVARWNRPVKIAIAGILCHACFILIRAASFYGLTFGSGFSALSLGFESLGLICISIAAVLQWKGR